MLTKTDHQIKTRFRIKSNTHVNNHYETTLSKKIELSFHRYLKISPTTILVGKKDRK